MHWITLLLVLLPLLQTAIEGLPVRVDYDESDDEWDDDFENDFVAEGPSYDDPKQYMRKRAPKSSDSLWKVNLNHTSKFIVYMYCLPKFAMNSGVGPFYFGNHFYRDDFI